MMRTKRADDPGPRSVPALRDRTLRTMTEVLSGLVGGDARTPAPISAVAGDHVSDCSISYPDRDDTCVVLSGSVPSRFSGHAR